MNNLQISDDYQPVLEHVKSFIKEKIEPMEEEFHSEVGKGGLLTVIRKWSVFLDF